MQSLGRRIAVVMIALMHFSVWSVYAPVHRMIHHSAGSGHSHLHGVVHTHSKIEADVVERGQAKEALSRSVKCRHTCAHHHASTSSTQPQQTGSGTQSESEHSPGCPDDDESCVICGIAVQQGLMIDLVSWIPQAEIEAPLVLFPEMFVLASPSLAFDSRGPPAC
jgi:hypothetical protein